MRGLWWPSRRSADPSAMPDHALSPVWLANRKDGAATQARRTQSQATGTKLRQSERDILTPLSSIKSGKRGKPIRKARENHVS